MCRFVFEKVCFSSIKKKIQDLDLYFVFVFVKTLTEFVLDNISFFHVFLRDCRDCCSNVFRVAVACQNQKFSDYSIFFFRKNHEIRQKTVLKFWYSSI